MVLCVSCEAGLSSKVRKGEVDWVGTDCYVLPPNALRRHNRCTQTRHWCRRIECLMTSPALLEMAFNQSSRNCGELFQQDKCDCKTKTFSSLWIKVDSTCWVLSMFLERSNKLTF